jgi:transposase
VEEKLRIVEETLQPGASVSRVARMHGVNANQLFSWRRLYSEGRLKAKNGKPAGLLAVHVKEDAPSSNASPAYGTIQIELAKGTIRIVGMADPGSLHAVLEYLTR